MNENKKNKEFKSFFDEIKKYKLKPERIKLDNEKCFLEKNNKIFLDGIFLVDFIKLNDYNNLYKKLEKIYFNDSFNKRNLRNDISYMGIGGWTTLGSFNKRNIETLPEYINLIKLGLKKITNDVYALEIFIYFKKEISIKLNNIINSYHYPQFEESDIDKSIKTIDVEKVKENHVNEFISNLKKEVIIFLSGSIGLGELFNFYFYKSNLENYKSLNIFSFSGEEKTFLNNRCFLNIINFTYNKIETYTYNNNQYLFSYSNDYYSIDTKEILLINRNKFDKYEEDFLPYHILFHEFNYFIFGFKKLLEIYILKIKEENKNIIIYLKENKFNNALNKKKVLSNLLLDFEIVSTNFDSRIFNRGIFNRIEKIKDCNKILEKNVFFLIKELLRTEKKYIYKLIDNTTKLFDLENINKNIVLQNSMQKLTFFMFIFVIIQVLFIKYDDNNYVYNFFINIFK